MRKEYSEMFRSEVHQETTLIERSIYFISALEFGVLSFAELSESSGLLAVASLILIFFAYGFLYLYNQLNVTSIQYEDAFDGAESNHPVHHLTGKIDLAVRKISLQLVCIIFSAFAFLITALVSHFADKGFIPSFPIQWAIILIGVEFLVLMAVWIQHYSMLSKSLDDFIPASQGCR